jgi:predicted nucleotidyltransferase
MAIPTLNADGILPEGIHACGLDEIKARFGSFQGSDRRPQLFAKLEELIGEFRKSSLIAALVVNGSFVTGKAAPNDVDVLIVLGTGHDWQADLTPSDYALLSHSRLRRRFGFDVLVAEDDSELYWKYVRFYSQSRELPQATKGVLRIKL